MNLSLIHAKRFSETRKSKSNTLPHYDLKCACKPEESECSCIYETSYVKHPATGKGFLAFSSTKQVEPRQPITITLGGRTYRR